MTDAVLRKSDLLREQYTLIRHKSGLTVYVFPKALTSAYAMIAARFGSVDNCFRVGEETEFVTVPDGVAHFLEHKMFENEDGEDTFAKFARTGAQANAYTSFSATGYLFSCTENLYPSLEILLRSVFSPYFTGENVKKEQGIIGQEIRMGEDNPGNALLYGLLRCLYEKSALRLDIAGSVSSIAEITPEILYRCHRAFYNPGNMILCVCGEAEPEKVMETVDRVLPDIAPVRVESRHPAESPAAFRPRTEKRMQVAQPLFCVGYKDTDISPDPYERMRKSAAFELLAAILFGHSSPLYEELYDSGLISPSFDTWNVHCAAYSFFTVSGDSAEPDRVCDRIGAYLAEAVKKPLDREDFERCRRAAYSGFIKEFDSTEEIANSLVMDFAADGGDIFAYAEILRDITPEYTETVMKKLFRPEAKGISLVLPLQ